MSTSGSLNTRLILAAALGVASLTVFMFVLRRKTRRLLKSEDNPETMESDQLEESTQIDQNAEHSTMTTTDEQQENNLVPNQVNLNNSDSSVNDANSCTTNTTLSDDLAEKLNLEDEAKLFVNGNLTNLDSKMKFDKTRPPPAKMKFDKTKLQPTKNGIKPKESTSPVSTESSGYKNAESPNSEGSADSGRATGGPFEQQHTEAMPIYEFEVPNTLVGLIIGIQGKTISELCTRADVRMLIRPHHTPSRFETHQICSIEGKRSNVNKCLHMIRYRFPQTRFPDLNLQPVFPPNVVDPQTAMLGTAEPTTLSLPVGVPCEVYVCDVVDAGHFFVQLPAHPTFSSLETLDLYTMNIYSHLNGIPVLPKPCAPGVVCVAPTANGFFRAITLHYEESDDSVIVRLADYGGFMKIPRSELRQIRSDLTSLPLQAIECYLSNVQPVDGTAYWSKEASDAFSSLCTYKIVQAEVKGYNKENNIPYIELLAIDDQKKARRVDSVLMELGYAKLADPTRMLPVVAQNHSKGAFVHHNSGHHNLGGKFVGKLSNRRC